MSKFFHCCKPIFSLNSLDPFHWAKNALCLQKICLWDLRLVSGVSIQHNRSHHYFSVDKPRVHWCIQQKALYYQIRPHNCINRTEHMLATLVSRFSHDAAHIILWFGNRSSRWRFNTYSGFTLFRTRSSKALIYCTCCSKNVILKHTVYFCLSWSI